MTAHLLKAVHYKPLCFHDRPHLRCQRAEQLPRLLFCRRIRYLQRGYEVDVRVWIRLAVVESDMDHARRGVSTTLAEGG